MELLGSKNQTYIEKHETFEMIQKRGQILAHFFGSVFIDFGHHFDSILGPKGRQKFMMMMVDDDYENEHQLLRLHFLKALFDPNLSNFYYFWL